MFTIEVSVIPCGFFRSESTNDIKEILRRTTIFSKNIQLYFCYCENANKIINLCQKHEFITNIYGNEEFQIFPFLKITLKKNSFFGDDERFILFNLADFLTSLAVLMMMWLLLLLARCQKGKYFHSKIFTQS